MNLIINADDGFYSEPRDIGIVRGMKTNAITDVSVLVNSFIAENLWKSPIKSGVSTLYDYFVQMNFIPGLHLNLTEGYPLSGNPRTIVDERREMLGKEGFYEAICERGNVDLNEVEEEINLQIERFIEIFGNKPTHVDGHQHVHVLPGINTRFARILRKHGIRLTRMPIDEELPAEIITNNSKSFYELVIEYSRRSVECFNNFDIRYPMFIGLSLMNGNLRPGNVRDLISKMSNEFKINMTNNVIATVIELMVHPGLQTLSDGGCGSNGPDSFSQSPDRLSELVILESSEFREMLRGLQITLTRFASLNTQCVSRK